MSLSTPTASLPLLAHSVRAGFPSPADDYLEEPLNLNDYLSDNPLTTFLMRVKGDSMSGAGILEGDILVVNRSLAPQHGDIVVAVIDNDFTVKRLWRKQGRAALLAENPAYPVIQQQGEQEWRIWGVVSGSVRKYR
ncbi:translesion error-prone DNA polymerase V autoproteolytic subunit [uncultured Aquitalea sp.]|uniref:LexA family protein n=1 Tax=uncultured Aquitalea sp. TaxID=540272 RepID=UPI0025DD81BB|nr:translesion error-prone DNA polymerase V autoproteolytic subunit [uncultured Aquitalea sp.]